jgi:hypothetical protein
MKHELPNNSLLNYIIMKKNIISTVQFVLSVCDRLAQNFIAGPGNRQNFEQSFRGATNVRFESLKNTCRVNSNIRELMAGLLSHRARLSPAAAISVCSGAAFSGANKACSMKEYGR